MRENCTEMVFILDRSGSMFSLRADTIGGFNSMIQEQKKEDGDAIISTILFNDESTVVHNRVPLDSVPEMTESDYAPGGMTALIDAIGSAISHISDVHNHLSEDEVPERTVFVITTDGRENASRVYSSTLVKKMIEKQKKERDWEFIFVGANIDSVTTGETLGISSDRVANYKSDVVGTSLLYKNISKVVSDVRSKKAIDASWKAELEADLNQRR